jgi:hypothetical protein
VAILVMFLIVLFVLIVAVAVNWSFLVLVNRDMQNKASIIALAAAPELLDEHLLHDAAGVPVADQADDRAAALQAAGAFRQQNNAAGAAALTIEPDDMVVRTGFVADVTRQPCLFDESAPQHNTVYVFCGRRPDGHHPVQYLADITGLGKAVDIRGGAYAALDNLVVGFRPLADLPAPVMPVAIDAAAWAAERAEDTNGDLILEMVLRLRAAQPPQDSELPPEPNAAILLYRGADDAAALATRLPQQVLAGLFPADLPFSGGKLGPATPLVPFPVAGTQQGDGSDPGVLALGAAINSAAGKKRVFPLYHEITEPGSTGISMVKITGFVACVVMGAQLVDNRLTVRVEPCFIIHPTVWTVAPAPGGGANPERNLYIHKLRLSR